MCGRNRARIAGLFALVVTLASVAKPAYCELVLLAEKTPIKLRVLRSLTSGKARVGEAVPFEIKEDIKDASGQVLIMKGTYVAGTVDVSKKRGSFGRSGRLEFTIVSVTAVDGYQIPVRATGKKSGGVFGVLCYPGAVASLAVTAASAIAGGTNATIEKDSEITAYVDTDIMVDPTVHVEQVPAAALTIVSSQVTGSAVSGELRNDGPNVCAAEVVATFRKGGKNVGTGKFAFDRIDLNQTRAFSIPIQGSTDGAINVTAAPKPLPPALAEPPATTTAPTLVSPAE
jgi:hypothetical protein